MFGLEVLGAVAAALQLGDAALESSLATVKYFAKLKHASREILAASNDLEKLQQTFGRIEQALRSETPDVVDPTELRAIEDSINVAKELCLELEKQLEPLQLDPSDGVLQKARKAISSLRQSGKLSAISTRIKAAETSVNALLTTHSITAVGKLKEHGSMEHRLIEEHIRDSSMQSTQQHHLVDQRILNLSHRNAREHRVINQGMSKSLVQSRQTHELVKTHFQQLSDQNANQCRLIEQRIDRSEQALGTRIAAASALPERILESLNSPRTTIRPSDYLAGSDVHQLISSVEQMREAVYHLASKPVALAEVCELSRYRGPLNPARPREHSSYPFSSPQCICRGKTKTSRTQWKLGSLSVLNKGSIEHLPTCPLSASARSRTRLEIRLPLSLVVSAAIELTFEVKSGAGGRSFSSGLRYYGTVERSRSPAFAMIDRYNNALELLPGGNPRQDLERLLDFFNELFKVLAQEPSLAALKDVQGTMGFGPLEVAILQRSKIQTEKYLALHAPPNGRMLFRAFTSGILSYQNPRPSVEDILNIASQCNEADMDLIKTPSTPLECAVGWQEGVEILLKAGANGYFALDRAAAMLDLETLNLLLDHDCSLFGVQTIGDYALNKREDENGRLQLPSEIVFESLSFRFGGFWTSKDPRVISCIVNALCDRRSRLQKLAELHMNPEEQQALGFLGETPLDSSAGSIYQKLLSKNVSVPPSLWPGTQPTIYRLPGLSQAYMEALYQAGFHEFGDMNLVHVKRNDTDSWELSELERIAWLAEKGVCPKNVLLHSWSFLHKIAGQIRSKDVHRIVDIVRSSILSNYEVEPDDCLCYCSSNGCLPIKIFLSRCEHDWEEDHRDLSRQEAMDLWVDAFEPSPEVLQIYRREICRLEIFHRLDMVHTCCISTWPKRNETERAELQSEDLLAWLQLEFIMDDYDRYQSVHPGPIELLWKDWWAKIDRFLPESKETFSIWDRKNWHLHEGYFLGSDRQLKRQSLQVLPAEYENMDMLDILFLELGNGTSNELDEVTQTIQQMEAYDVQHQRLHENEAESLREPRRVEPNDCEEPNEENEVHEGSFSRGEAFQPAHEFLDTALRPNPM
ncbi:MAG: hypothetical protein Q9165_005866 [Trypethelium subeluteriae]